MRRFSKNDDFSGLEAELRNGRPEPGFRLLQMLVAGIEQRPTQAPARRSRFALALAFAVVVLGIFATLGGVSYAKSSVASAAKSGKNVVSSVVHQGDNNRQTSDSKGSNDGGKHNGGNHNGGNNGEHGDDDEDDDPSDIEYKKFVIVCYPITIRGHNVRTTIVVRQDKVSRYVGPGKPGTLGPCRYQSVS